LAQIRYNAAAQINQGKCQPMPHIEESIVINRPISDVFRFVSDFRNGPQWQKDITNVHQSEGKTRVGAMITETRSTRMLRWRLDLNADILGYVPNKSIEYKGVLGQFPVAGQLRFEMQGGATQITHSMNIRTGCLFSLFGPLLTGIMRRRTRRTLNALRQLLEARQEKAYQSPGVESAN
jgi:uncharacterized membrane protein